MAGRCAACKYLRKGCPEDCIFAPYFPSKNPQRFEHVHRIHGAKNVATLLKELESSQPHIRAHAIDTLCYEAESRIQNPVYGCAAIIYHLQQKIHDIESELAKVRAEIAVLSSNGHGQASEIQLSTEQVNEDRFGSSSKPPSWFT